MIKIRFFRFTFFFLTIGAALMLRCAFFVTSIHHLPASVDETSAVLQAKRISEGQFPLLFPGQPYLFPVESYLHAPLVRLMPRNAFGARYVTAVLGLISLALYILILLKIAPLKDSWPGVLLLLFPSSYWLMLQTAYALPGYSSLAFFPSLIIYLGLACLDKPRNSLFVAFAGLFSGLALSSHMLSLCFVIPCTAWICMGRNWKEGLKRSTIYFPALLMGLIPFLLVLVTEGTCYQTVLRTRTLIEGLRTLLLPARWTLTVAMGFAPCTFPDNASYIIILPSYVCMILCGFYLIYLTWVSIIRMVRFLKRLIQSKWPSFKATDVFAGTPWLCMILFLLTKRANSNSYRYLLPLSISFPFILSYAYSKFTKPFKIFTCIFILLLMGINLSTSIALIQKWNQPDFAKVEAGILDLRPVIDFLDLHHIKYCYAPFWIANRITYETDERIICSEPYNIRFFDWPLPDKDIVDQATNVAYVLPRPWVGRFRSFVQFEQDLKFMNGTSEKVTCKDLEVYYDFQNELSLFDQEIPQDEIFFSTASNTYLIKYMKDNDFSTFWRSDPFQEKRMWIQMDLKSTFPLNRLTMVYNGNRYDFAFSLNILVHTEKGWEKILSDVSGYSDPFTFRNGHPVYGDQIRTVRFLPVNGDKVRIEIEKPNASRCWSISEIKLFQKKTS